MRWKWGEEIVRLLTSIAKSLERIADPPVQLMEAPPVMTLGEANIRAELAEQSATEMIRLSERYAAASAHPMNVGASNDRNFIRVYCGNPTCGYSTHFSYLADERAVRKEFDKHWSST